MSFDFRTRVVALECDARQLPMPDESVDLIITSPPYWSLRSYQDGGEHYAGQLGSERTWQEWLDNMWDCTREWMRVLKPDGNMFVNIGDVYGGAGGGPQTIKGEAPGSDGICPRNRNGGRGIPDKSLGNLPARYAIGCTDQLGLIERAEIVWHKPNGIPESVKDRVRRAHESVYHFTKTGRYYQAVHRIREPHVGDGKGVSWEDRKDLGEPGRYGDTGDGSGSMTGHLAGHPLGKLPSSVWTIPTFPLNVPRTEDFDLDHFAAFPPALVQKIILGWSPAHVCQRCGKGRFPVTAEEYVSTSAGRPRSLGKMEGRRTGGRDDDLVYGRARPEEMRLGASTNRVGRIIGNACECTPYTDHPENRGKDWRGEDSGERKVTGQRMGKDFQRPRSPVEDGFEGNTHPSRNGGEWKGDGGAARTRARLEPGREGQTTVFNQWGRGDVREYHLDGWERPPSSPGVVLDPFGGTGTTAIVAAILGRRGITCDLSHDYASRLVPWRMNDRAQMRALLGVGGGK